MQQKRMALARALAGAGVLIVAGCGGSSGGDDAIPTPIPPPISSTTSFTTTVIDGVVQNALVCLDKNSNSVCDTGESQGKTDAAGKAAFAVPNADVGKFSVLAVVGTDAVNAETGPVKTPYTMTAPADQSAVVSPLTTLVQQIVTNTGTSTANAAATVQSALGLSASLFQDYTKAAAPTDGSIDPATVARLLVLTNQEQSKKIASVVGGTADDGKVITTANLDQAIQNKLLTLLPQLLSAVSDPVVRSSTTAAAKEAALLAAATGLVSNAGLTVGAMPTVVAINNQTATPNTVVPYVPSGGLSLANLRYADASNFFVRNNTYSLAQDTPDVNQMQRSVARRLERVAGLDTTWGHGSSPTGNSELSWNGASWVGCPINFESTSSIEDANGKSSYNDCDGRETGSGNRATFDIGGRLMIDVYNKNLLAGYSNLYIANPSSALGASTFPPGSTINYQVGASLTTAITYNPVGEYSPVGSSNVVGQYTEQVAADAALNGGVIVDQPAGRGCSAAELNGSGSHSVTLESMIATHPGNPCINVTAGTFVYGGVTYSSGLPNESWGGFTVSLGSQGTAPINRGSAPGYFSGNTKFRVAFKGSGTNAVTYYACQERFIDGSTRNCTSIGTGTYAIETLGDGRAMTFNNVPQQIKVARGSDRIFVERGGYIYYGYKDNLAAYNVSRLNSIAANALFAQLGIPAIDPEVPLSLTFGSYQGVWDLWAPAVMNVDGGTLITRSNTGAVICQAQSTGISFPCAMTSFNPATGEFVSTSNPVPGVTNTTSGTMNFMTGLGSGTFNSSSDTPSTGTFVIGRR